MFRQPESMLADSQGRDLEFQTLEPDRNGDFRIESSILGNADEPSGDDTVDEPEDRRQVVFINSQRLSPGG